MDWINSLILVGGALLLLGIISSKFSARLGVPVLVLFLGVGMLAGSEGVGGIAFEDYAAANAIGSLALLYILFDGGLQTPLKSVRLFWPPALVLSTLGVLLTSLLTGLAAMWVLDVPLLHGLLLGAIVGSTDAAAVFSVLRSGGLKLPERLSATLEIESGSNDPMAIFLTVGVLTLITAPDASAGSLVWLLVSQFGWGTLAGLAVGYGASWVINRMNLGAAGLYPILASAFALLAFGAPAVIGGSGFLAVYIAGIVLGNQPLAFKRGILLFHNAAAWLSQIVLFVMLGLLSFPSHLLGVLWEGLLIAVVLIAVARPLAVWLSVWAFKFKGRELLFLSWVGLKGAVPITLATFPLMAGMEGGELVFNLVFFIVLISAITQGWSLGPVARWLGLAMPSDPEPPLKIEVNALHHVDGEIVEFVIAPPSRVIGRALKEAALPDEALVTLVVRGGEVLMPKGSTRIEEGDHVFVATRQRLVPVLGRLLSPAAPADPIAPGLALSLRARAPARDLLRTYGGAAVALSTDAAFAPIEALTEAATVAEAVAAAGADGWRVGDFRAVPGPDAEHVALIYDPLPASP